jgi:hypothetical protein
MQIGDVTRFVVVVDCVVVVGRQAIVANTENKEKNMIHCLVRNGSSLSEFGMFC